MIITAERPKILRITYRQDKGDEDYCSCLWAWFDIDVENWNLSISSDCGSSQYRWPRESRRTFLWFLSTVRSDYLARKLFGRTYLVVDGEQTLERILECAEFPEGAEEYDLQCAKDDLEGLASDIEGDSINYACERIEKWMREYNVEVADYWELVKTDYRPDQKKILEIWDKHIVPAIKQIIKENREI